MLQRNCIFSTFKFIVATGKEFVPLVPAKSGSKCIAMEIFSESSKMLYLYFAHSSFFFKANLFNKGLWDEGFSFYLHHSKPEMSVGYAKMNQANDYQSS